MSNADEIFKFINEQFIKQQIESKDIKSNYEPRLLRFMLWGKIVNSVLNIGLFVFIGYAVMNYKPLDFMFCTISALMLQKIFDWAEKTACDFYSTKLNQEKLKVENYRDNLEEKIWLD